jgi:hypothetical protein
MFDYKTLFKVIYPIADLSILIILFGLIYNFVRNKVWNLTFYLLLFGYVVIDLSNYFLSPYFVTNYHNNFPLLNLNILFDTTFSLSILYFELKENKRIRQSILMLLLVILSSFIINLTIDDFSLFKGLKYFRMASSLGIGIMTLTLLIYVLSDLKVFKQKRHLIIPLIAFNIYYLPKFTFDFFIDYQFKLSASMSTAYILFLSFCFINIIRNILLAIYAMRLKKG